MNPDENDKSGKRDRSDKTGRKSKTHYFQAAGPFATGCHRRKEEEWRWVEKGSGGRGERGKWEGGGSGVEFVDGEKTAAMYRDLRWDGRRELGGGGATIVRDM